MLTGVFETAKANRRQRSAKAKTSGRDHEAGSDSEACNADSSQTNGGHFVV
jgi:hypothetical protein